MIVQLNEVECRIAEYMAKRRYQMSREQGIVDRKIGSQSSELTDLEGIAAEIAFCKLANVYPDLDPSSPKKEDCVLRDGRRVDVKATVHNNGRLVVARWKQPDDVDLYALMIGKFPTYRCAGIMTSDEIIRGDRLKSLGYGLSYVADQEELQRPDEFFGGE